MLGHFPFSGDSFGGQGGTDALASASIPEINVTAIGGYAFARFEQQGSGGELGAGVLGELGFGELGDNTDYLGQYVEGGFWEGGYCVGDAGAAPFTDATGTADLLDDEIVVTAPETGISGDGSSSIPSVTVTSSAATPSASASISVDGHQAVKTLTVTVSNDGYGNKYYIDGTKQASLSLHEEGIYRFDVSDSSVSGHPFKFSTTSDGTHNSGSEYTTNVTVVGTAGNAGAYVEIEVTSSTPDLYYYCGNHNGMGGSITFVSDFDQVPFIIDVTSVAGSVSGGSTGSSEVGAVTLTAAEASATGAAEATFADSIEVGLTAPQSSAGVAATASAALVTTTITSPDPTLTGTASASADTGTVSVFTPTSRISGVEVPDALPRIDVTAPEPTTSAGHTVTVSDNLSITVTSPEPDARITTVSNHAGKVDRFTTKHNFGSTTVTLSFPTTFNVPSSVSSTYAGSWTVNSYTTMNKRLIAWDRYWGRVAIVWFDGKKNSHSSNNSWMATWSFDLSGNLTLVAISPFMQWANFGLYADYVDAIRGSSFIDGDLETHPNASGDVQMITPAVSFNSSGTYAGTWLYVNIRQISLSSNPIFHTNRNSLADSYWTPQKVSSRTDYSDVTIFPVNVGAGSPQGWPPARTVLPWRGDWGSRSRQNYLVWPITVANKYYLYLAAENGDLITVYTDTSSNPSASSFRTEAAKFSNGTYPNYCIGDSTDDFIWFHDDSTEYKDKAEKYLSVSESVQTFDTDMEVDITDSTLQINELLTSITAPSGVGVQNATGSAALVTIDVTAPTPSGAATAEAALVSVTVTAAEPTSTGVGSASAGVGTATVTQPASSATGGATASADTGTATVSSPEPTSTGQGSVSTSVGTVTVTSPESSIDGSVSDDIGTVTVTAPEPTLAGDASADLVSVSITQPDIDGFAGTGSADVGTVTVTTPTPVIDGVEVPDALSTISVSAPEPTAKVSITHTVTDALGVTVTEPSASASSPTIASAALVTTNVSAPEPTVSADANKDVEADAVSVTAPEPSVAGDASSNNVTTSVTSPEPSHTVIAEPDVASISVTAAEPSTEADGNAEDSPLGGVDVTAPIAEPEAVAKPALVSVSITAPYPDATGLIGGQVSDVPSISVTAPEPETKIGFVTSSSVGSVSVTAPEPTASTGSSSSINDIDRVDVTAPDITGFSMTASPQDFPLFVIPQAPEATVTTENVFTAAGVEVGVNKPSVSVSGFANVTVSDAFNVNVSNPESAEDGDANETITDEFTINVSTPTGSARTQSVTTTIQSITSTFSNTTSISFSDSTIDSPTLKQGSIVLEATNKASGDGNPAKAFTFAVAVDQSASGNIAVQARKFSSLSGTQTSTTLVDEQSYAHDFNFTFTSNFGGWGNPTTKLASTQPAFTITTTAQVTDSNGNTYPKVLVYFLLSQNRSRTDEGYTLSSRQYRMYAAEFNPATESFSSSLTSSLWVGGRTSSGYLGGSVGGGPENSLYNNDAIEYIDSTLNLVSTSDGVREDWRAYAYRQPINGTNKSSLGNIYRASTNTSARTQVNEWVGDKFDDFESRDSDATHLEGATQATFTYTRDRISKTVQASIPTITVSNAAPTVSAGAFTGGNVPQVSVTTVDADGTEDRLAEVELVTVGVGTPVVDAGGGFLSEPDGPPTISVTSPDGAVSALTTVQEIGDIVEIDTTAPEPRVDHDFEIVVSDLTAIDMDAPQPAHEVSTTNTVLNVTVSTPEVTATNSSIAEASLVTVDVISPDGGLLANSTALVDLLDDQIVGVSAPSPELTVDSESRADVQDVAVSIDGAGRADSEARPTGVNVFVSEPRPTITSTGNATATAEIPRADVSSPQHTLTIESEIEVAVQTVSVSAPEPNIEITALASIPEVSVTTPEETLTVSSEARPDGVNVSIQPPQAYLQAGASAEGSLVSASITSPEAGHTVATDADVADVAVTAPEPNAFSFATANEVLLSAQPVNIEAPEPSVLIADIATASIPEVSVTSPQSNILSIGEGSIPEISVVAPESTTATDDIARGRADAGTVSVAAPEVVAQGGGSVAQLVTVDVIAPEAQPVVEEFPTNLPVVSITAPEATVTVSATERTVRVEAESRVIVVESDLSDSPTEVARRIVIEFEDRKVVVER